MRRRVVSPRIRSYPPDSVDPKIDHISRMNFVLANLEAGETDPGAMPVLLDHEGNIAEYSAGNFRHRH